ncbi:MAG TPA: exopolysaccharide biosynthesis polyprenyl glycosylphosphotransferase [Ferruginibacter sp.]|nr:exopolysaccharide biosynthesis polyprenyl glycosylphosphotransferase [Ferruginibacter sp.]
MNQPRINIIWYVISDIISALITWVCFYYLRTVIQHYYFSVPPGFYVGGFLYVLGWISLYFLIGSYENIYEKSRVNEFFKTMIISIIGSVALLFFFILKNPQVDNGYYYLEFYSLLVPVFIVTYLLRLLILTKVKKQLKQKEVFFNVLLIGSGKNATQFFEAFYKTKGTTSYHISSFLNINGNNGIHLLENIKKYDTLTDLNQIITSDTIEEVIITVEKNERTILTNILQQLSDKDVNIKITPDAVDILSGAVQTNNIMGVPLIDVHSGQLPGWQKNIKRFIDIVFSALALVLLLPVLIYSIVRTKSSSKGSIFFLQDRIGFKGKIFTIYKFRSMVQDAEKNGPQLSSDDDTRITNWGRTMRKWRLDELPQLWNILKGEMSLVGPRPERKFYIDQIELLHPEYNYLFKVKPGLTSWGMVQYGYASTVDEMISRMPYDLMYVENISIGLDLKIMLHTISIIVAGKGK